MATLIPLKGIIVHRNGKSVMPELGKPFDFSDDEIKDIPEGYTRELIVEQVPAPVAPAAPAKGKAAKGDDGI